MFRRPSRALLATLAVSTLAVVGLDNPTALPAHVRADLEPTPTPAFSMPRRAAQRPDDHRRRPGHGRHALPPARANASCRRAGWLRRRPGPHADLRARPRLAPDRAVRPQPRRADHHRPQRRVRRVRRPGHDRDRAPGRRLQHALHREVPERIRQERHGARRASGLDRLARDDRPVVVPLLPAAHEHQLPARALEGLHHGRDDPAGPADDRQGARRPTVVRLGQLRGTARRRPGGRGRPQAGVRRHPGGAAQTTVPSARTAVATGRCRCR